MRLNDATSVAGVEISVVCDTRKNKRKKEKPEREREGEKREKEETGAYLVPLRSWWLKGLRPVCQLAKLYSLNVERRNKKDQTAGK